MQLGEKSITSSLEVCSSRILLKLRTIEFDEGSHLVATIIDPTDIKYRSTKVTLSQQAQPM